jgi:DNA-binding MarR family transcriptional regulator
MNSELLARFRRAYWQAFRELDTVRLKQWERSRVTLPQLRVLYQLRRQPDSTTGELSRALRITVSTTSGLVIKLVEHGLVARTTVPDDRRQIPLRLTEQGAALLGELSGEGRAFLEQVATRLGGDLPATVETLERLAVAAGSTDQAGPAARSGQADQGSVEVREACA